jgi:hypothetical protein
LIEEHATVMCDLCKRLSIGGTRGRLIVVCHDVDMRCNSEVVAREECVELDSPAERSASHRID